MVAIDPRLQIRSVTLAVSDLARSSAFYERALGLPLLARDERSAQLGADRDQPALTLLQLPASTPLPPRATGLFHVAWLHPSRAALAESLRRIAGTGWRLEGASDHGVSEALYLSDPDGLGIEIYADRPAETWAHDEDGRSLRMFTEPLDLEDLLGEFTDEPGPHLAAGTRIGHIHLKVADVPRTAAFYRDTLGLEERARLPSAAFLAAGGYHHHVGLNSWQSDGEEAAPETAPGLRTVVFELADHEALDALAERVGTEAGEVRVRDPDGQLLRFVG